ncbi:MAG TPA: FAD-dependent oxidoreductase, partial [Ilumatobacter sp.]
MAMIIVAGGGICGSAAALMLARDGHDVTVLERDESPVPATVEAAWAEWNRRSVAQFRFAHVMLARGHQVMSRELPDVVGRLSANGGLYYNIVHDMLPSIEGAAPLATDDRFDSVTGRRSSIEWALATTLEDEPNVTVRRGSAISGLVTGSPAIAGVPHVAGVRLADGEVVDADLVIDATGRRSPTIDWITDIGGRPPTEVAEDSGFMYIGRFFRSADGSTPTILAPILSPLGSISILCIPSDNGTWATTLYTASSDVPMRRLRDPEVFDRVVRELPLHAHWIVGEPISEISSMSGVVDRTRRFVVDDVPVVTGMLSIADAHACTNPSIGRGMTLGLMHTVVMRDAVRTHIDAPAELAKAFDAATVAEIDPWHAATRDLDRTRITIMEAAAEGRDIELGPAEKIGGALLAATRFDEQCARWFGEMQGCLALPMDVLSREGVLDHILTVSAGLEPEPIPGPDR